MATAAGPPLPLPRAPLLAATVRRAARPINRASATPQTDAVTAAALKSVNDMIAAAEAKSAPLRAQRAQLDAQIAKAEGPEVALARIVRNTLMATIVSGRNTAR